MTELAREDDTGIMRDGVILSGERGELRGLGVRSVSAETVGSSGGFRRSGVVLRCGSLGDISECPFNVLFPTGAARV
jgi:hypothetical protein